MYSLFPLRELNSIKPSTNHQQTGKLANLGNQANNQQINKQPPEKKTTQKIQTNKKNFK